MISQTPKIVHSHQPGQPCNPMICPVAAHTSHYPRFTSFEEAWPGGIEKKTDHETIIQEARAYHRNVDSQQEAIEIIESLLKMIDGGAMATAPRGDVENRQPAQILRQMLTWSNGDIAHEPRTVRQHIEEALRAVLNESRKTEDRAKNVQEQAEARTVVGVLDYWLAETNRSIKESTR